MFSLDKIRVSLSDDSLTEVHDLFNTCVRQP